MIKLIPKKEDLKVPETLNDCLELEFEEVVVIGLKQGFWSMKHSGLTDTVQLVGILEGIKHSLLMGN